MGVSNSYSYGVLIGLIYFLGIEATFHQETASSLAKILRPVDNLGTTTTGNGLFLLIPSNSNLTDIFSNDGSEFSLFKLNTDALLDEGNIRNKRSLSGGARVVSREALETDRMSRKMNLFRNLFSKPKHSPLYLVNGTVCRFVNSAPICTTIFTNGLPVSLNGVIVDNAIANRLSGLNQNGNQQFFQQPQQQQGFQNQGQLLNNNNNNNQQQQQQFNNQQQQGFNNNNNNNQPGFNTNQQLRPAGLMNDDTPDINVSRINNITSGTSGSRLFKSQLLEQQSAKIPSVFLGQSNQGLKSGPLNLLSLARPMRQLVNSPSNLASFSSRRHRQQNNRGGRKGD